MKIREFQIFRYGPLGGTDPLKPGDFTLFWGANEDGKTLTLEALLRLLLGRTRKLFPNIERVAEQPEGYAVLHDGEDAVIKLPEQGPLPGHLGISTDDFANLFVIRNSDLSIAEEERFFTSVGEKLTGLRTSQIQAIAARLRRYGDFTDGMDTQNTRENRYLKQRVHDAGELISACRKLAREAREAGLDRIERDLVASWLNGRRLSEEIATQERARLVEKHRLGHAALEELRTARTAFAPLRHLSDEQAQSWRQAARVIDERAREREHLQQEIARHQEELERHRERREELGRHCLAQKDRQRQIEERLQPVLRTWGERQTALAERLSSRRLVRFLTTGISAVALASLAGVTWNPLPAVIAVSGATGLAAAALIVVYYLRYLRPAGVQSGLAEQIRFQAGELGVGGDEPVQIQEQLQQFADRALRDRERLAALEGMTAGLERALADLRERRLPDLEQRIAADRERLAALQTETGLSDLEALNQALISRRQALGGMERAETTLTAVLGKPGEGAEDAVAFWERELDTLTPLENNGGDTPFSEGRLEALKQRAMAEENRKGELSRALSQHREKLLDIERRAGELLPEERAEISCRSLADLEAIAQRLGQFRERVQRRQGQVRTALAILDDIAREEQERASSLFGSDSPVSRIYRTVTGGNYPEVTYHPDSNGIRVRTRSGESLLPEQLSSGACDQLYFAIRIALGEQLLRTSQGFFLLDDPFLKSDRQRLRQQMLLLQDMVRQGWQVLLFSAKDEIRTLLEPDIAAGTVTLLQAPLRER